MDAAARSSSAAVLDLTLRPDLSEMEGLARGLSGFGTEHDLSAALLHNISVCVDELVGNAIRHGFADGEKGSIRIRVLRDEAAVRVEVSDDGPPFNPLEHEEAADVESTLSERRVGRLGILLVRELSDEMSYRHSGGRNVVSLIHFLDAENPRNQNIGERS